MISVIMPSYNHQKYVGKAIESVLTQTYQEFEFLIVDDSSFDNSAEVIRGFNDPRMRTFFAKKRMGAVGSLQFLLSMVKGDYVALLNSDDYWADTKLEEQVAYIQENPQIDICFTQALMIDANGNLIKDRVFNSADLFLQKNRSKTQWVRYFWDHGNCLCHPSILVKRECYAIPGLFNVSLRQLPDFYAWVRLVQKHSVYIIQKPLVYHRRLSGRIENTSARSHSNSVRMKNEYAWIMNDMITRIDDLEFIDAFSDLFVRKKAQEKMELVCERFFLLSSRGVFDYLFRIAAMWYFFEKASNPDFILCLKENYKYSLEDFYRFTGNLDFEDGCNLMLKGRKIYSVGINRFLYVIRCRLEAIMRRIY